MMGKFFKSYPPRDFTPPEGMVFVRVDSDSGKLVLPTCPLQQLQVYLKGTEPREFCDIDHSKQKPPAKE